MSTTSVQMELQPIPKGYDLVTLEPGLYATQEFKRGDYYDIMVDLFFRDVRQQLVIRIDDDTRLPLGVEAAYLRGDGRRVVKVWIYADHCQRCVFGRPNWHSPNCESPGLDHIVSCVNQDEFKKQRAERRHKARRTNQFIQQFVATGANDATPQS